MAKRKTFTFPAKIGRPCIMKRCVTKDPLENVASSYYKIKANTDKDVTRFTARSPATKPLICKKNGKARLEYAEVHVD